jgi:hypothetical protein
MAPRTPLFTNPGVVTMEKPYSSIPFMPDAFYINSEGEEEFFGYTAYKLNQLAYYDEGNFKSVIVGLTAQWIKESGILYELVSPSLEIVYDQVMNCIYYMFISLTNKGFIRNYKCTREGSTVKTNIEISSCSVDVWFNLDINANRPSLISGPDGLNCDLDYTFTPGFLKSKSRMTKSKSRMTRPDAPWKIND